MADDAKRGYTLSWKGFFRDVRHCMYLNEKIPLHAGRHFETSFLVNSIVVYIRYMNRGSKVKEVTCYRLGDQNSILGRSKDNMIMNKNC
jgi:hypothetical protein